MIYRGSPAINFADRALRQGRVIAYPTEGVWGVGCDPANPYAVKDLLKLKSRPVEKGLILIGHSMDQFAELIEPLEQEYKNTLEQSWPGPYTWLLPHRGLVPRWICGQFDSVAVRVSDHPLVGALTRAFGGPIVSTSANPAGKPPAQFGWQARRYFGDRVFICPGQTGANKRPSQVRDLLTGKTLRA